MNKKMLQDLYSCFSNYVRGFYSGDADIQFNIKLKEDHTARVYDNISSIGGSIGLSEDDLVIAQAIALFHDLGRFPQYVKYRTFSDKRSENHAMLGVKVLEESRLLDMLPEVDKQIILKAVKYHNVCCLPDNEDDRCLLFSKLIRDADKLDIFGILVEYYEKPEDFPHIRIGEASNIGGYSQNIISDVLNGRNILFSDVRTSNDMKLLRLSWIFDINFKYTLIKIRQKRYVERIIKSMPQSEEIFEVKRHVENYIDGSV